jgi:exosortase K
VKTRVLVVAVAILIAWGLKRHYADARPDELSWILSPTARLVGVTTGETFVMQAGEGYFSRERLFLIEKSCAGVNFMIAAFAMLVFALFHRVRSGVSATHVLGVSLLASYSAAVLVNAGRITIAMWLAGYPATLSSFAAADVHRVEGITVYFAGLVLLYELAQRIDRRVVVSSWGLNMDARSVKGPALSAEARRLRAAALRAEAESATTALGADARSAKATS